MYIYIYRALGKNLPLSITMVVNTIRSSYVWLPGRPVVSGYLTRFKQEKRVHFAGCKVLVNYWNGGDIYSYH